MKAATFSIKEALGFGWAMTKEKFWFLCGLTLVYLFSSILVDATERITDDIVVLAIANVASMAIDSVIVVGMIHIMLRLHDGKIVKFSDIFSQYRIAFRYFVAVVLYTLMCTVGLLFLIVPGIYLVMKYQFFMFFLVDKQVGVMESFRESARITDGHKWHLFKLSLATIGVLLLGLLVFVVGILVAYPLLMLAYAHVYRKLSSPIEEKESNEEKEAKDFLESLGSGSIAPEQA